SSHWAPRRITVRASAAPPSRVKKAATAIANDAATSAVASQPAALPRRRPTRMLTAKPAAGSSGSSQTRRSEPWGVRAPSPLEQVDVVDAGRRALAEDDHQDAEADDHLGGGHHHDEEGEDLAVEVAGGAGEGEEREVDGVEHQLDAHEHHDGVAAHQHPDHADG